MEERKEILELKDVMQILGLSEKAATRLLKAKDCPTLPRKKNQKYRISRSALMRYVGVEK